MLRLGDHPGCHKESLEMDDVLGSLGLGDYIITALVFWNGIAPYHTITMDPKPTAV